MVQAKQSKPGSMEGKRESLFVIAYKFFPTSFLVKAIGITLTSSLFIYNYLFDHHVDSILTRALLTLVIVVAAPTIALYLITLARAPRIRRREEGEALHRQHVAHGDLKALQVKEQMEAKEIVRLEQVASGNLNARKVKDKQEDERWELLNESLRLQKETVELASEERLLVAQQVKEIKDEGEVMRKGLVSDDLEARHVKDLKEDKRWASLNESLRLQKETGELASEERLLVAQQVKEVKDEGEVMRKGLVSDDLEARHVKDLKEDNRWASLNESLRLQKETGELASEERLLVAQQVKDVKDEREIVRIGLALDDLKARDVKDRKEDERWELLNESLRLQKETVELASEERLLVAQQVKDVKDEGEVMRKGLVSDDLEARHIKENKEAKRWEALYERLRLQDERSDEREQRQLHRDEEQLRLRDEDDVKEQYRTLFTRYTRVSSSNPLNQEVADGLEPIPDGWLNEQPEVLKNPALMQLLQPLNKR